MWVFYAFASLLVVQAAVSLRGGARYLSYFRRETATARGRAEFAPYASVIAPCRGLDQGLRANLAALFRQDYPAYEIIFVTDAASDPALAVVEEVRGEFAGRVASRVLVAGEAASGGQKVHNLRAAVGAAGPKSEVFVFVDSDARPREDWLRQLVAPLADERVGAATGYRWFIPVRGGFSSALRAVWNASIASALGEQSARNFCWGGSTAIRRETFERAGVLAEWEGAASDDFAMTRALGRARLPIHFVPACLTASHEDCGFRELLEFTTRQLKITRVYAPHLWRVVLFSNLLFVLVFYGGIALAAARAALGLPFAAPLALVLTLYALGTLKALLRWRAVRLALAQFGAELRRDAPAHLLLWPLASALYLYNALAALFSRRIVWRGITYELKSPHETVIIAPARRH